jgi:hypothetical protein
MYKIWHLLVSKCFPQSINMFSLRTGTNKYDSNVRKLHLFMFQGGQTECGRVSVQPAPLITHGQKTARGQFPWHAALYQSKDIHLKYICGGSLIGPKTILTGTGSLESHCMVASLAAAFD